MCSRPLCGSRGAVGSVPGRRGYASAGYVISHLHSVSVAMAKGKHPVPFRTRKLSPSAPMVLRGGPRGRVGRRRTSSVEAAPSTGVALTALSGSSAVARCGGERGRGAGPGRPWWPCPGSALRRRAWRRQCAWWRRRAGRWRPARWCSWRQAGKPARRRSLCRAGAGPQGRVRLGCAFGVQAAAARGYISCRCPFRWPSAAAWGRVRLGCAFGGRAAAARGNPCGGCPVRWPAAGTGARSESWRAGRPGFGWPARRPGARQAARIQHACRFAGQPGGLRPSGVPGPSRAGPCCRHPCPSGAYWCGPWQ